MLGATNSQLLWLLSSDFVRLVLVANLFVAPMAYFAIGSWLQNYPYSTGIPFDLMVITAVSSMVVIVGAVSFHAYRAAITNPARTLKYE